MRGPLVASTIFHLAIVGLVAFGLPSLYEREQAETRIVPIQFVRIDSETAGPPGEDRPQLPEARPAERVADQRSAERPEARQAEETPVRQEQRPVEIAEAPRPVARPSEQAAAPAEAPRPRPPETEASPTVAAEAPRTAETASPTPAAPSTPTPRPEPRSAVPATAPTVRSEARRPPPAPRARPRMLERSTEVAEASEPPPQEAPRRPEPEPQPQPQPQPQREPEQQRQPEPPQRSDNFADRISGALASTRQEQPQERPAETRPRPDMSRVAEALGGTDRVGITGATRGAEVTISEIDALRRQIERCWRPPEGLPDAENLAVQVRVNLTVSGEVRDIVAVDAARMNRDRAYATAVERAMGAVRQCAPYNLPRASYANWQSLLINFDPKEFLG